MYNCRANWYGCAEQMKRYYSLTDATVVQLAKLNIPSIKATYALDNAYGSHYFPMICNMIRNKDVPKIEEYLMSRKNLKRKICAGYQYDEGMKY